MIDESAGARGGRVPAAFPKALRLQVVRGHKPRPRWRFRLLRMAESFAVFVPEGYWLLRMDMAAPESLSSARGSRIESAGGTGVVGDWSGGTTRPSQPPQDSASRYYRIATDSGGRFLNSDQ